jgi:hypothetical protein
MCGHSDGEQRKRGHKANATRLTIATHVPIMFFMQVETLGVARSLGWKVHMRCAHGPRDGMKRVRECVYRRQLDLDTLVSTRGPNFPLSRLESRLMCPRCGSRKVAVVFEPPANSGIAEGA